MNAKKTILGVGFLASCLPLYAETSADHSDLTEATVELAEVSLKGELIDRTLQDSMTSAAVTTGLEIESKADIDLGDVIQREAGVNLFGGTITIRGVNSGSATGLGIGNGGLITTTIDGVRVSEVANQFPIEFSTWDLEQVEVLRGPQSTQNGTNSLAGSITVQSKDPVHYQEGKVRVGAANGSRYEGAFAVNTPIVQDVLAVRFSAEAIRSDGFVSNPTLETDDVDSLDRETYRLGILWEPTDHWTSVLKLTYTDADYGSSSVDASEFPGSRSKAQFTEDISLKEVFSVNLENTLMLTDTLSLESSTSFSDFDILTQFEGNLFGFLPAYAPRNFDQELFDQELKLRYEGDNGIRAVVGAFYSESENTSRSRAITLAPFTAPFPLSVGGITIPAGFTLPAGSTLVDSTVDSSSDNFALFGEVEFQIVGALSGVVGARYDDSSLDGQQSDAFLPKVGFVYEIDSRKNIGFTYQEGFRAGGERTYGISDLNDPTNLTETVAFDPEIARNYEIAFRSEWLEGDLVFNANIFYTQWEDMQVRDDVISTDPDITPEIGATVVTNAAESELWGGEIDLNYRVNEHLEVYASLAYVETEFEDFVTVEGGMELDLSGNQFVGAPEWSGNLGAIYNFGEGWQFAVDASYTDSTFSDAENLNSLENDAYWVVDLRVAKFFSNGLSITAYIDNAFDEDYTTSRRPADDFVAVPRDNVGLPLTFGIFAQYDF